MKFLITKIIEVEGNDILTLEQAIANIDKGSTISFSATRPNNQRPIHQRSMNPQTVNINQAAAVRQRKLQNKEV